MLLGVPSFAQAASPYALNFSVSPSDGYVFQARLLPGETATVSWGASPIFKRCIASGGWNGAKATSGTEQVVIKKKSKILYLTCMSENGLKRSTEYVLLRSDSTAVSVDMSLEKDEQSSVTLKWSSKNATTCTTGIYCIFTSLATSEQTQKLVECYKSNVWKEAPWQGEMPSSGSMQIPFPMGWTGQLGYGLTCKNDRSSAAQQINVDWTRKVKPDRSIMTPPPVANPVPPPHDPPTQMPSPVPDGIMPPPPLTPAPTTPTSPPHSPQRGRGSPQRGPAVQGG